jgi:hypothetical protein
MPAFGPTSAFKEASGFPREYADWSYDQFKQWLFNATDSGAISRELRDQIVAYARQQLEQGFPEPEVIRAIGAQVVPGVEEALQRRTGRIDTIQQLFAGRVPTSTTMDTIGANNEGMAGDIQRTAGMTQDEIDRLYSAIGSRNEGTSQDIVGNIGETTRSLQGGVNDSFGTLRKQNFGTRDNVVNAIGDQYGGLLKDAGGTYDAQSTANKSVTGNLKGTGDTAFADIFSKIGAAYGLTGGQLEETIKGLEGGAGGTYEDILSRLEGTFGDLKSKTTDTFGNLKADAGQTYDEAIKEQQAMAPTGEAQVAQTARSFAPAVAAAKGRLRARGIGGNEAQSQAIIGDVEAERARAMDDKAANFGVGQQDRMNALRLGRQKTMQDLGTGELSTNIGLSTEEQSSYERLQTGLRDTLERLGLTRYAQQKDINLGKLADEEKQLVNRELMRQGLSLGELQREMDIAKTKQQETARLTENKLDKGIAATNKGLENEIGLGIGQSDRSIALGSKAGDDYRAELMRRFGVDAQNEASRTQGSLSNLDSSYTRTQDWRNAGNQAALLQRALETEDWQTAANILREQNQEELTAMDVRNLAYNKGQEWLSQNLGRKDAAMSNLANMYAQEGSRANTAAQIAQGFGNNAATNYAKTYQQEAPKGNWGTRALIGAGAAGLDLLVPGLGSSVGGAIGGAFTPAGGGGGAPGSGQYGGGWGGGGSGPYGFSYASPQANNPWAGIYQGFSGLVNGNSKKPITGNINMYGFEGA